MKKLSVLSIIVLIILLMNSCATDSGNKTDLKLSGSWQKNGLTELEINNINSETSPVFYSTNDGIYTIIDEEFYKWGLEGKSVLNAYRIEEHQYLAAIKTNYIDNGDITLYKSNDNGQNWFPYMTNFGGAENKYTAINDIAVVDEKTFFTSSANIARTTNGGESWESVFLTWEHLGRMLFVKPDPNNKNILWAGGENAIFEPTLIRSDDGGDNWERLTVLENTETSTFDIAIHPANSTHVMVGLGGGILKSTNNGETWKIVFDQAAIYTFTHGARNPEIVYASGINAQRQLFFIASADFGDTWKTIEYPESPSQIYTNDMVSVLENGKEVLYFGTNKGVYSYTFEN